MLAFPTIAAGVVGIFFYDFEMTPNFFGDGGRILAYFVSNLLERHSISETGFDDDAFAES